MLFGKAHVAARDRERPIANSINVTDVLVLTLWEKENLAKNYVSKLEAVSSESILEMTIGLANTLTAA